MNRLLLALLLAAACKHSTSISSTSHSETSTVTDTKTSESGATTTTTTVTEQPGETTTTTEEFGPPDETPAAPEADSGCGSATASNRAMGCRDGPLAEHLPPAAPKLPRHGPLVKRTVSVAKYGIETTETRQVASTQGTAASETKAAGKVDTQAKAKDKGGPSAGCVGASWIWGLGILVFAVASILGILKFRKA